MLLNFTVSNFRSIRDEATLSMNGGRYRESEDGCRAIKTGFTQFPCALRAAAIYGANAAGKSSFVKALEFLQGIVNGSARDEAGNYLATLAVCRHSSGPEKEKSLFEVNFVEQDIQYTYGVVASSAAIHEEWLHAKTQKGRTREVFSRVFENDSYDWHFSSFFKSKKMVSTWQKATRPNALFLTTAIQLNSEELKPVHEWLTVRLRVVSQSNFLASLVTSRHLTDDPDDYSDLLGLLQMSDPSIVGVSVDQEEVDDSETLSMFSEEMKAKILESSTSRIHYDVKLSHKVPDGGQFELDLEQESDGTQIVYRYAAPFLQSIKHDFVVVVDELDQSLHPLLLEQFVSMFTEPRNPETKAQIVFTTHDSALLGSDVLGRDQIWFADNSGMRGTKLTPLADYKPRKTDRLQKAYLQGRFKAVPRARLRMLSNAE